jgi:hypothetical protein
MEVLVAFALNYRKPIIYYYSTLSANKNFVIYDVGCFVLVRILNGLNAFIRPMKGSADLAFDIHTSEVRAKGDMGST